MNMKSKVISFRVDEKIADIIEAICKKDGISKNELLSQIISSKMSVELKGNNLTDLEKLLVKLQSIVSHDYDKYNDIHTPSIIIGTKEDGEYIGKRQILVGDDTIIREKNGKFYIFDFHNEDDEPIWLNEKEVLDFYEGQNLAYEFPIYEESSHHFIRGFVEVAKTLLKTLEHKLSL